MHDYFIKDFQNNVNYYGIQSRYFRKKLALTLIFDV